MARISIQRLAEHSATDSRLVIILLRSRSLYRRTMASNWLVKSIFIAQFLLL